MKKKHKNTNYYIDTAKYSSNVIETLEEKAVLIQIIIFVIIYVVIPYII